MTAGMGYVGAGGQRFMSSALAKASMPGGYSTTTYHTPPSSVMSGSNVSSEARSALQRAMGQYQPGGGFGKGIEAGLQRGRTQSLASGMQNLVGAGLAGTTMAAGLGKKYEEEVAAPTRARVEDIRAGKLSGLESILAQMEQGGFQANLDRQFQISQQLMSRPASQAMPYSSPAPSYQPQTIAPRITAPAIGTTSMTDRRKPISIMESASRAYAGSQQSSWTPGGFVGSVDGDKYVYGQHGQIIRG